MSIFVVEDELLIRLILVEELLEAGFDVKEAETGERAVAMIDELDPPLRLLITDIHMPGTMNGIELGAYIRRRWDHIPIIYTTGRPEALNQLGHLGSRQSLIRKPYAPFEVVRRIQQHLAT